MCVACTVFTSSVAYAEPLRLRGDALAQTRSPVGLLVLQGSDRLKPWLDAESVSWFGVTNDPTLSSGAPGATGDVLTLSVRMRHAQSGSELRLGRMLVSTGSIRPLHLDGARGVARSPWGTAIEGFAGSLVTRGFDYPEFAWASGARLSQAVADKFSIGASYMQARSASELMRAEAGADFSFTPTSWMSATGRSAFDTITPGLADALLSASVQNERSRLELFFTHRSPGRLLPATSLFSVLGDFASTSVGATARRRLFPRLDVIASGTSQTQGGVWGGQGFVRTMLALDDDWAGSVGLEARRVHFGESRWSGVRATITLPFWERWRVASELELVVPDPPDASGSAGSVRSGVAWPWMLVSGGYRTPSGWDFAVGVEASSGRTYIAELHGLARVSYNFELGGRAR